MGRHVLEATLRQHFVVHRKNAKVNNYQNTWMLFLFEKLLLKVPVVNACAFLFFYVVMIIEPLDAQNNMPTRLISLTPNDMCSE